MDDLSQVVEIAGETIHAVDHNDIPVPHKDKHGIELRPVNVLARSLISEDPVEWVPLKLAADVLVECADPDITDPLTVHEITI